MAKPHAEASPMRSSVVERAAVLAVLAPGVREAGRGCAESGAMVEAR
jgi:hypothetical protein